MPGPREGFTVFGEVIPDSGDLAASGVRDLTRQLEDLNRQLEKERRFAEARFARLEALLGVEPLERPFPPSIRRKAKYDFISALALSSEETEELLRRIAKEGKERDW